MSNELAERIRMRLLKAIEETEQDIRDMEWWNTNRPEAPPMDCEPERIHVHLAKQALAAFDAGNSQEAERLAGEMVRNLIKAVTMK